MSASSSRPHRPTQVDRRRSVRSSRDARRMLLRGDGLPIGGSATDARAPRRTASDAAGRSARGERAPACDTAKLPANHAGAHSRARVSRDRRRQERAVHAHRRELQGRPRGCVQARLPADHDRADARQELLATCPPGCRRSSSCSTTRRRRSSATSSRTGKLTIDPTSGVGIWLDFAKTHPGLEEPRDVLHAERRRGGPQLLRRQPEVRAARRRSGASRK